MPLLDGKYEVMKQQRATPDCAVFEAAAPDGTLLRIEWYDLPAEQEDAFERYRRTLKRLKRTGKTALYDVTSRPGARYVAWERPSEHAARGREPELEALLEAQGFSRDEATLLRERGQTKLFGLAFGNAASAPPVREPVAADATTAPGWWTRIPRRSVPWVVTGVLLLGAVGLTALGFERHTNDRIVSIPDLVGERVNDAATRLHVAGFGVTLAPTSSDSPPGTVLSMEPMPGTELRPGRVVHVSYALPAGQLPATDVPRLVGELYPDGVLGKLEGSGLQLGAVAHIAADVPPGAVIAQSAPAGVERRRGETIDILVSDGPRPEATFLPDLIGLSLEDAIYLAEVAGIRPDQILHETVASTLNAGEVLSQSLAPHRPVPLEDAVLRLIVGEGSAGAAATSGTPSFVGMDRESVQAAIGGTMAVDIELIEALSLPEGVIDQEPSPGDPPTGRMRLTMNVHPLDIPVPDVRARVREPELRAVPFGWSIEPGIPEVTATVYATTLEGERTLVHRERAGGGETIEGAWLTNYPGVVTFRLELNGQPYSSALRVP